jgi:CrcB protein
LSAIAWIGLGLIGGVAAIARFRVDMFVQQRVDGEFPFGTLVVNLSGSLCLGILTGAGVGGDELLLLGTGALGSFTTFSTWMLESERLGEEGDDGLALANLGVSVAAGLAAALAGWGLGAWL